MPAANLNKASKIALCGVCGSLSIVIMMISSVVPIASIALPAISGCVLIPVVAFASVKYAYMVYAVVSVLSFLLVADREAVLIYVLFFGYYPALFATLSKIQNSVISWFVKLIIFNAAAVLDYFIVTAIFMIPQDLPDFFGRYALLILLVFANVVFILYDIALKGLIDFYFQRFHHNINRLLFRK